MSMKIMLILKLRASVYPNKQGLLCLFANVNFVSCKVDLIGKDGFKRCTLACYFGCRFICSLGFKHDVDLESRLFCCVLQCISKYIVSAISSHSGFIMSNHLVSQQFQFPDGQMAHVDNLTMDSSTANLQNKMVGHVSHASAALHFAVSNGQLASMEPTSNNSSFQNLMVSKNQTTQTESEAGTLGFGTSEVMLTNLGPQKAFLPSKRKADMEATVNYIPQHSIMPNKRTVQQMGTFSRFPQILQPSSPTNKLMQMQSKINLSSMQNLLVPNKKMVRNESISSRSGSQRVQTPKGRTTQNGPLSKVRSDSSGAVRSKMREQLAAALALISENQDKTASSENDDDVTGSNPQTATDSQHSGSGNPEDVHQLQNQESNEPFVGGEASSAGKPDGTQGYPAKLATNEYMGEQIILPDEDVSFSDNFFVKDDLLQGNGLSWALDLDMQLAEEREKINVEKTEIDDKVGNTSDKGKLSPENLAAQIEAELFKLFGGVNKKYKEKGRSLLFNLKDRTNPELSERVVSGEITPERLCSMTAEELASKELTEWRMAKAEEFAQMVVLPDTDLDMRRLVKKTHKGEYQVEMEEMDDTVVEVSGGPLVMPQTQSSGKNIEAHSPKSEDKKDKVKIAGQKKSSENHDVSGSLVIPSDGTDLMQGMMVDELKDAEFLPPIISLDEFMESLNSEPPFEYLPGNAGQSAPPSEKENTEAVKDVAGSDSAPKDHVDSPPEKTDEVLRKDAVSETVKPKENPVKQNISPHANVSTVQHIWEGALQLSITSSIKAFGVFRSGEKTSIAEWPSSLEIKGRVRLVAFEKFIKDLPNSRSRAVMVIHFVLKDNSDEGERASLHEAIESYVTDNRLGFAEPATGVELYLCPTRGRVVDMLSNYVSKDRTDIFNSSDNGLIGVIVWRKAHKSSTISPNSASHQKHTSTSSSLKRQHNTSSRRQQEIDANVVNVNTMNKATPPASYNRPPPPVNAVTQPQLDDDDSDIPPGFGPPPGAARDDDDLPEFNFSGNVNHPRSSPLNLQQGSRMNLSKPGATRPVDQIRELIHKYGQTGASSDSGSGSGSGSGRSWVDNRGSTVGLGIEPWNDDDDDIPEWRPQSHQHRPQSFHQPLQLPYGSQHQPAQQQLNPAMTSHATLNAVDGPASAWHQGARWAQPPSGGGQYYGSRSRGY